MIRQFILALGKLTYIFATNSNLGDFNNGQETKKDN